MWPGSSWWASEVVDYCVTANQTYYIEWDDHWSSDPFSFDVSFYSNTYYLDSDNDSHGDPNISVEACTQPNGYVINNLDCDDNNSNVNPAEDEVCDSVDNNCDGVVDEYCLPCMDVNLVINTITQSDYAAEQTIISDALVESGQNVLFTAGAEINLDEGFEVENGSSFHALIMDCIPGGSSSVSQDQDLENLFSFIEDQLSEQENVQILIQNLNQEIILKSDENSLEKLRSEIIKMNPGVYHVKLIGSDYEWNQKIILLEP